MTDRLTLCEVDQLAATHSWSAYKQASQQAYQVEVEVLCHQEVAGEAAPWHPQDGVVAVVHHLAHLGAGVGAVGPGFHLVEGEAVQALGPHLEAVVGPEAEGLVLLLLLQLTAWLRLVLHHWLVHQALCLQQDVEGWQLPRLYLHLLHHQLLTALNHPCLMASGKHCGQHSSLQPSCWCQTCM